jgi:cytochrome c oxidase assembly protein subunit 11
MASLSFTRPSRFTTGSAASPALAARHRLPNRPGQILDQTVKVRFDASLEAGDAVGFPADAAVDDLRIGETGLAFYEAHNPTDRPVAGTASFNVFPYAAGGYFTKIDCFCFEMQVLQPGETVQMPVTFYVDPAIVTDREGKFVQGDHLSYTFHETDCPKSRRPLTPLIRRSNGA